MSNDDPQVKTIHDVREYARELHKINSQQDDLPPLDMKVVDQCFRVCGRYGINFFNVIHQTGRDYYN